MHSKFQNSAENTVKTLLKTEQAGEYARAFEQAQMNPVDFWQAQSNTVDWYTSPGEILSKNSDGFYEWFRDGELNTSYLALDKHIDNGLGDQTALIYDSPVTNVKQTISYKTLLNDVELFAGVLKEQGVIKGDRVLIYMPMIPQAVIGMLACARLGAIHSVVFGGFAANELAIRINDCQPKLILTASCGIEIDKILPYKPIVDSAIEQATHSVDICIVYQREQVLSSLISGRDFDWNTEVAKSTPAAPVRVQSNDPLYILYTSGTTGSPKGVVRDNGSHAVAMKYSMSTIYGMKQGDVFWAASDIGWVVGHSYIVYAPLLTGCTTVLYEGKPIKTPDAGAFWRVCEEYAVNVLFTAPTAFRAIRKEDPEGSMVNKFDLSKLDRLYLAGERLDPSTFHWLSEVTNKPVIDHWWQTETGWAIAGNPVGLELLENKVGSAGKPSPGFNVEILDEKGKQTGTNETGSIAIKLPLPPGCLATIWQNNNRYKSGYLNTFEGYYITGDGGYLDEDGYLYVMGRTDDVINVAGHRLSTGEMEEVISNHPNVAECAVIGVKCPIKGQTPLALIVLKNNVQLESSTYSDLKLLIREQIGAIASLKQVLSVQRLPKTRSGKILRKIMREMIDGEAFQIPSTIDDPDILSELKIIFSAEVI